MKTLKLLAVGFSMALCSTAHAVEFIYDDLRNYNAAVEQIDAGVDPVEAFQAYMDAASPGLLNYAGRYGTSAENLAESFVAREALYRSLATIEPHIRAQEDAIRRSLERLHGFAPETQSPDTFFLVGQYIAGGAVDRPGLLVSVDVFALRDDVDFSSLDQNRLPRRTDTIQFVAAHEAAHYTQFQIQGLEVYRSLYTDPSRGTLLNLSLREGGAEFVSSLASGGFVQAEEYAWGREHEGELWARYQVDMTSTETGDWMWRRPEGEQPQDMGYFMGHQIAQAYYENAEDKPQAIRDILGITDYEAFLAASGYANRQGTAN